MLAVVGARRGVSGTRPPVVGVQTSSHYPPDMLTRDTLLPLLQRSLSVFTTLHLHDDHTVVDGDVGHVTANLVPEVISDFPRSVTVGHEVDDHFAVIGTLAGLAARGVGRSVSGRGVGRSVSGRTLVFMLVS